MQGGGCLLCDGNSNYAGYGPEELLVKGDFHTASAWVAPRAFEWDGPDTAANGTGNLTAIAGQHLSAARADSKRHGPLLLSGERPVSLFARYDGSV